MSADNKAARVHGGFTNRKTPKVTPKRPIAGPDRRVVFKSVLHNPLQIQWPSIPPAIQPKILAAACDLLQPLAPYYLDRRRGSGSKQKKRQRSGTTKEQAGTAVSGITIEQESKKRKRDEAEDQSADPQASASPQKKARVAQEEEPEVVAADVVLPEHLPEAVPETSAKEPVLAPPLLAFLTIGINEVTRLLEAATILLRERLYPSPTAAASTGPETLPVQPHDDTDTPPSVSAKAPRLILACRSDVDPPLLLAHLPLLVASYNSLLPAAELAANGVLLIPLQKRAEHALAESIGLRRVAVVGFDADAPGLTAILESLQSANVDPITASWLASPQSVEYIPTHIKQVRTSAPKDMNKAKRERLEERKEAKERKVAKRETEKAKVKGKKDKAGGGISKGRGTAGAGKAAEQTAGPKQ